MKRYVSGMMTGALVGAVMAGFWLLRRRRASWSRLAWNAAKGVAPQAIRYIAKETPRMVKRRIS